MKTLKMLIAVLSMSMSALVFAQVDLNKASISEIAKIEGVSPSHARAIVEYRENAGGFKSVEDLKKVQGLDEKTFEAIKGKVTIEAPAN